MASTSSAEYSTIADVPPDAKHAIVGRVQHKRCSKCSEIKPIDSFYGAKSGRFGRMGRCKSCILEYNHGDKAKESLRKYRQSETGKSLMRGYQRKFSSSAKGKDNRLRYERSDKGRETKSKYRKSERGRETKRKWRTSDAGKSSVLRYVYGITKEQYDEMVSSQGGVCPGCLGVPTDVDHNHETGEFRGVLCNTCNVSMGALGDDPDRLRRLADYLDSRGHYAAYAKLRSAA